MYKYVVGKCHWKPREQADAGHDLILNDVAMFETSLGIAEFQWPSPGFTEFDGIEIVMNLSDLQKLEIGRVSGVIPGQVIDRPYDLQSKLDRVRNAIIARALGILMKHTVERTQS